MTHLTMDSKDREMKSFFLNKNDDKLNPTESVVLSVMQRDQQSDNKDNEERAFEDVLEELGMPGRYQITQICLLLISMLKGPFVAFNFVFTGYAPPFQCERVNTTQVLTSLGLQNDSSAFLSYGECEIDAFTNSSGSVLNINSTSCPSGRNFSGGKHISIISEWDLVCESTGIAELVGSFFFFGQMVGALTISPFSDRYGRRNTFIICSIISFVLELVILLVQDIYIMGLLRFVNGIFVDGSLGSSHVLILELLTPTQRTMVGNVMNSMFVFSTFILVGVAYVTQDYGWRALQIAIVVCNTTFPLHLLFLFESPRWLVIKGRSEEALEILRHACKRNKKSFAIVRGKFMAYLSIVERRKTNEKVSMNSEKTVKSMCWQFLAHKEMAFYAFIITFVWFNCDLTYYGLFMMSTALEGDMFLNFFLMSLIEIPCIIIGFLLMPRVGRRSILQIFLVTSAASLLVCSLMTSLAMDAPNYGPVSLTFYLLGKLASSVAFLVIFIWAPEIFPTQIRTVGCGLCVCFGKIGSVISPYIRPFQEAVSWGPAVCFCCMSAISFVLVSFLPEMKDINLQDTSEGMIELMKKKRSQKPSKADDTSNL